MGELRKYFQCRHHCGCENFLTRGEREQHERECKCGSEASSLAQAASISDLRPPEWSAPSKWKSTERQ